MSWPDAGRFRAPFIAMTHDVLRCGYALAHYLTALFFPSAASAMPQDAASWAKLTVVPDRNAGVRGRLGSGCVQLGPGLDWTQLCLMKALAAGIMPYNQPELIGPLPNVAERRLLCVRHPHLLLPLLDQPGMLDLGFRILSFCSALSCDLHSRPLTQRCRPWRRLAGWSLTAATRLVRAVCWRNRALRVLAGQGYQHSCNRLVLRWLP